jgi:hypothetical protein
MNSASVTKKGSVALAIGRYCKAKGAKGCALCLIERGKWNGSYFPIINAKVVIVDGKKIKENTWYTLINGKLNETKNSRHRFVCRCS